MVHDNGDLPGFGQRKLMPLDKPYHLNVRGFITEIKTNADYSSWAYIVDRNCAAVPHQYVRAYLMLQADLQHLLEFVEPADECLTVYSFKRHASTDARLQWPSIGRSRRPTIPILTKLNYRSGVAAGD